MSDGVAQPIEEETQLTEELIEARDSCPVSAITIEKVHRANDV